MHEATTSLACSSSAHDIRRLSQDACVQTNSCTVYQVNPVHTTDLSRSLSDTQITQTTIPWSSIDSENNTSPFKIVNAEPRSKEAPSIIRVESMAQKDESTSVEVKDDDIQNDTSKTLEEQTPTKPCEQNGIHSSVKDILDHLDVASLSMPDSVDLKNFDAMKEPLRHITSCQSGNFYFDIIIIY